MTVSIFLGEKTLQVDEGTRVKDIFRRAGVRPQGLVAATLNHGLVSLHTEVQGECKLRPVLVSEPLGRTVRRRTISHMLQALVVPRSDQFQLVVGQSLAGGYYYEVSGLDEEPDEAFLEGLARELSGGLHHLAKACLSFSYTTISVDGARRLLSDASGSKSALLDTWPSPMLVVVRLGDFTDIPHGPYAPDTSHGEGALVRAYPPGLILDFNDNGTMPSIEHSRKLWLCYRQTTEWNRRLDVSTVGMLNRNILNDREDEIIRIAEALHEKRIANISDDIAGREDLRFICVAGPSSAGKTTFMRRLSDQLRVNGFESLHLSLDDYYLDRQYCPVDENGRYDFESPKALNLPLIHEHFDTLLAGGTVVPPRFDFIEGRSLPGDKEITLGKNKLIIVEGIHGNNPDLTAPLPERRRYRVFVNALNQLRIDDHNRILTSDTRLLRRLVRDRLYRGTSAADTILQWESVLAGEKRYIYPYQDHTDVIFNSALVYETSVLKTYAQRFLLEVPRDSPARVHAYRLLRFLDLFVPVLPGRIPINSILREFIGSGHL